jgi:hypothetical protein
MWALEENGDGSKMTMGNKPCDTKDRLSHMGSHAGSKGQLSCNWSWQ